MNSCVLFGSRTTQIVVLAGSSREAETWVDYLAGHGSALAFGLALRGHENTSDSGRSDPDPMTMTAKPTGHHKPVGNHLREWRQRRRMSQLDLALEAEISARHL